MIDKLLHINFMRCLCTCWPVALLFPVSRCGKCDEYPRWPCEEPEDGKAYRLEAAGSNEE